MSLITFRTHLLRNGAQFIGFFSWGTPLSGAVYRVFVDVQMEYIPCNVTRRRSGGPRTISAVLLENQTQLEQRLLEDSGF